MVLLTKPYKPNILFFRNVRKKRYRIIIPFGCEGSEICHKKIMENERTRAMSPSACFVNVMDCFICLKPLCTDVSVHLSCHHGLHMKCMIDNAHPTPNNVDMKSEVLFSRDEIIFRFVNPTASEDDDNTIFCRFCHKRSVVVTTSYHGSNFSDTLFQPFPPSSIPFTGGTKPPIFARDSRSTKKVIVEDIIEGMTGDRAPNLGYARAPSTPVVPPLHLSPSAIGTSKTQYRLSDHYSNCSK